MSAAQTAQNLCYWLGRASRTPFVWPDAPNEPVLGRVYATGVVPKFSTRDAVAPVLIVRPGVVKHNRDHPEALDDEQRFTLVLVAVNANDQAGGAALVGGVVQGQGSSVGKGLMDVEPAVIARLQSSAQQGGNLPLGARAFGDTAPPPEAIDDPGTVVARALDVVVARTPAVPTFKPVRQFLVVKSGANVNMTFQPPPDTYDFVLIQIVRKAGATPPTNPTDGTVITSTLGPTATAYTDVNPGSGTWSYSAFGRFNTTRDPATGQAISAPDRFSGFVTTGAGIAPGFTYQPATATVVV